MNTTESNIAAESTTLVSIRGLQVRVPSLRVGQTEIVSTGRFLKIAWRHDEEWQAPNSLASPEAVLNAIRNTAFPADIFAFSPMFQGSPPTYHYVADQDNAAVVPLTTYDAWWNGLQQIGRRNVRTAQKKGVSVRVSPYDDAFVRGISGIYNESPVRLGKHFWHYGKDLETVRRENGTYLERSEYIGAYIDDALIGFIKLVYVGEVGSMMQILSMIKHQDKRTTNALIAKAVEVCIARGMKYLMYCKYVYGVNEDSLLTDFKKRNGFKRIDFPRYYVPLSTKGRLALAIRAQNGPKGYIPKPLFALALSLRSKYHSIRNPEENLGKD